MQLMICENSKMYLNYKNKLIDIYNKVNNILNSDGSVNAVEVSGILNAINVTMKACRDIAQPLPVRVMICEDFDKDSPSYGAMCFGSMGFMIAGIAFLVIGAGLIFVAARNALKSGKVKELKEAGEAAGRAGQS